MNKSISSLMVLTLILSFSTPVTAALISPSGLNPGDQYRIAFVTSGVRDALSADINDYNQFVTDAANAPGSLVASLDTSWRAIASTPTVNARDNTGTSAAPLGINGVPIYLVDGVTKIADSYDDLWDGSLDAALNLDESGSVPSPFNRAVVWTGTLAIGGVKSSNLALSRSSVLLGQSDATNNVWIQGASIAPDADSLSLYAISGVLTAVPEPNTLLLSALALIGLRRRRCLLRI